MHALKGRRPTCATIAACHRALVVGIAAVAAIATVVDDRWLGRFLLTQKLATCTYVTFRLAAATASHKKSIHCQVCTFTTILSSSQEASEKRFQGG